MNKEKYNIDLKEIIDKCEELNIQIHLILPRGYILHVYKGKLPKLNKLK